MDNASILSTFNLNLEARIEGITKARKELVQLPDIIPHFRSIPHLPLSKY